jgi:hypothetical protein
LSNCSKSTAADVKLVFIANPNTYRSSSFRGRGVVTSDSPTNFGSVTVFLNFTGAICLEKPLFKIASETKALTQFEEIVQLIIYL